MGGVCVGLKEEEAMGALVGKFWAVYSLLIIYYSIT
jgi:hypothetical protein